MTALPKVRHLQVSAYRDCAAEGLTQMETSARLGVSPAAVCLVAGRHNIKFKPHGLRPASSRSKYQDCASRGLTLSETAAAMGVKPGSVTVAAWRHGLTFAADRPRQQVAE